MASQVANLVAPGFGVTTKPAQSTSAKTATDDQFARLLDTPATTPPKRDDAPASQNNATSTDSKPASNDTAPQQTAGKTENAAGAAPTEGKGDDKDTEATGTETLADTLLAALAALGLPSGTPGTETGEAAAIDPAALKNIEDSLKDLSELLGMDMATLMQQLTQLAKTVSAEGGGQTELVAKLNAWVGERLGPGGVASLAQAEEGIAKLLEGLGQFAKTIPTEPALSSAQLKLPEPVLAAPAPAAPPTEKLEIAEPELKVEPASLERKPGSDKPEPTDASQSRNATAGQQAARPNGEQPNTLNLTPTAPAAAQADAPTPQVDTSAAPRVVQTGYQTSQQQLNLPQIAFELSRQVGDGNTRFQIRLDPAELGRIDVKLDIDKNGQVHARLTVEKAETLDLMQRDQRALEKALQQAGLDQSKTNLEFSLKQNPFAGDHNQRSGDERSGPGSQESNEETEVSAPAITLYRGALQASGLNILA